MSKIEQWEALLVDRTEHPSMSARTSYILILNVGASTDVTREGVVYELNVLQWGIISLDFKVIERNFSVNQPTELQKILLLSSRYFPLTLT